MPFFLLIGEESQKYGGVPPELFELKTLKELDLSYLALTSIPDDIGNLVHLSKLNVSNNPRLESISGAVGNLPLESTFPHSWIRFVSSPQHESIFYFHTNFTRKL